MFIYFVFSKIFMLYLSWDMKISRPLKVVGCRDLGSMYVFVAHITHYH